MSKSVMEAILSAFDEQKDCDVQFVADGNVIGAHCVVFRAMNERCPGLQEITLGWTMGDEPILIEEMNFDQFKSLLRYFYTEEISISKDNVFIFLSAAIQFKMGHLEGLCADYINSYITTENVVVYMNVAIEFQSQALQVKCQELFSEKADDVAMSDQFLNVSQPALSAFLDVECINIHEVILFWLVKRWMKRKCEDQGLVVNGRNMRQVTGDALYKIRFPTMTAQDFANSVTTIKGLLTDTEKTQVFETIMVFDSDDVECDFPKRFRCKFNSYDTPFQDMDNLRYEKVLYNAVLDQNCELQSMLQYIKDLPQEEHIRLTSFSLILQCCADLANSTDFINVANAANQSVRNELYNDLSDWQKTADTRNIQDIMTKYMGFRTKLNRICSWP